MSSPPTLEMIRERVECGVARLDAHDPNWALDVNVLDLIMEYEDKCVLGQCLESYTGGVITLGLAAQHDDSWGKIHHPVVTHGFDLADDELIDDDGNVDFTRYHPLTDAWRRAVQQRRDRGVVPVSLT